LATRELIGVICQRPVNDRRAWYFSLVPTFDELEQLGNTVLTAEAVDVDEDDGREHAGHLQMVVIGNGMFATYPLCDGAAIAIGRSTQCDITIDDESISRRHAIVRVGTTLTIEDVGSSNGTCVRGKRLKLGKPTEIAVGELVTVGAARLMVQRRAVPVRPRRLWTHDYFEARLEEECARVQRGGSGFALLRICPDRRARASFVEETLADLFRDSDVLGKYGPHEYEAMLPNTAPANADDALRRLEGVLLERGLKCQVTLACCPRDGYSPYQLAAKVKVTANGTPATSAASDIIVSDPQMQNLHQMVQQIAGSQISVLVLGETGVGKEVFARAVHRASPRASGPFVEINCAAVTETLLESELFGHEKGAFTDAIMAKPGLIETAHGGTLLLDEIGEMPLATQAKLLRVIEDSQVRRVGALKARSIDVRFVASTNANLESEIASGGFRRDLYYRLNAVTLVIPPLRERLSDLEALAVAFVARARPARPPELTQEALELMKRYSWPGNVRELKNVIERAVLLSGGGPIRPEHLPLEKMRAIVMTRSPPRIVRGREDEQDLLVQALERTAGNQTQAARILGISRRTLVNRLNENSQIQRPRKHRKAKRPKAE